MRRADRALTDETQIDRLIEDCTCIRLGFYDETEVYLVPLSFGYENKDGTRIFYMHSAKEGRKITLAKQNPRVGFELDCGYQIKEATMACGYSASYRSVIGNGVIRLVEDTDEKQKALERIMEHNTGKNDWSFPVAMIDNVNILKLVVTNLSAKVHA